MIGGVAAYAQQELHGGFQTPMLGAADSSLAAPLPSWPGDLQTGNMGAMVVPADTPLYDQLAAAQRQGRPPLPGRATNRLSAPADLQQELRAFAAGRPISRRFVSPPARSGSPFAPLNAPVDAAVARQRAQVPPDLTDHSGIMPFMGSTSDAEFRPERGYPAGAACNPGVPTNITDYAASLIGFGGCPSAPGAYPGAGAAGLHALETGLGLGGSGLATTSVPLLPSALTNGTSDAAGNPFQGPQHQHGHAAWPGLTSSPAGFSRHPQQQTRLPCLGRSASTPNAAPGLRSRSHPPLASSLHPASSAQPPLPRRPPSPFAAGHQQRQRAGLSTASTPGDVLRGLQLPAGQHKRLRPRHVQPQGHQTSSVNEGDAEDWRPKEVAADSDGRMHHSSGGRGPETKSFSQRKSWHEDVQAATAAADAAAAAGNKPKVGRPRKYDLLADAGSSGGEGPGDDARQSTRAKNASQQEALVRRRERNRASALEAYYRGKARRAALEGQLRALKEEDAALHALAAMAQLDAGTAVRIRQMLSAGVAAMEITRRLRSGQQ